MRVLSNRALVEASDAGTLVIDPRPALGSGDGGSPLGTISPDPGHSGEIYMRRTALNATIDLRGEGLARTLYSGAR